MNAAELRFRVLEQLVRSLVTLYLICGLGLISRYLDEARRARDDAP